MNKYLAVIKKPQLLMKSLGIRGILNWMDDKTYLSILYKNQFGKKLNFNSPILFSEKLQWLKMYDRKPLYTTLVDKYAVKEYVAELIGEEYIIPTLGVYDRFEDIDIEGLPDQFVVKCTHDSGGILICKNKKDLNIQSAKKMFNKRLKRNYFYAAREWPYKNVKPKIIVEHYLENNYSDLRDYKFFCFNGTPKYCQVISDRSTHETVDFYDMDWKHADFTGLNLPPKPFYNESIQIPLQFEKMKLFAQKLSSNHPFLRVDFYEVNGKLYFGELTFYPASGFGKFTPDKWNKIFGEWLILPKKEVN